jgi:hypothetical protein
MLLQADVFSFGIVMQELFEKESIAVVTSNGNEPVSLEEYSHR